MDRTTRYLILLFFFIVFLGLAPIIVLYVSGTSFDFGQGDVSRTGILDVQSDPDDAQVRINGKEHESTPTTIRFLTQGVYDIEVSKTGYHNWHKRLFVKNNQVTYAGGNNDLVKLLPDSPAEQFIADEPVTSMTLLPDLVLYSTPSQLKSKPINAVANQPASVVTNLDSQVVRMWPATQPNFVFLKFANNQTKLFSLSDNQFVILPKQFLETEQIFITQSRVLFAQIGDQLWQANLGSAQANPLLSKVLSVYIIDNSLYVARSSPEPLLAVYQWNGQFLTAEQILLQNSESNPNTSWPQDTPLQLLVTTRREIFARANDKLFRVNQTLEQLSDRVEWIQFNSGRSELVYRTPSGVWFYNFLSAEPALLYRSSAQITDGNIRPELGYGFIATDDSILAVETDTRNSQNIYQILQGPGTDQLYISQDDRYLFGYNPAEQTVTRIIIKN